MKSLIGLAIIALLSVFGSRSFEKKANVPYLIKRFFADGLVYLIIGYTLGPALLDIINEDIFQRLSPILTIGFFWIGFLFGINLKMRDLKKLTPPVYILAFGQSIFTFAFVGLVFFFLFKMISPNSGNLMLLAATITIAICASGTAQATLLRLTVSRGFRGPTAQFASVTSTLDDMAAILLTGFVTFFLHRTDAGQTALPGIVWTLVAVLLGSLGGLVIKILLDLAANEQVKLLVILGGIAMGAGLSAFLHISPIFVGALTGFVYVNISERDNEVFEIVARSESTLYILFLLLVGGMLSLNTAFLLWLVPAYVAARILGKVAGSALFIVSGKNQIRPTRLIGLSLLSQGGFSIAIAIHFVQLYPSALADTVVTVVIIGVLIFEVFAAPLALWTAEKSRRAA